MPTIISHTAVPLAIGLGLGQNVIPPRLLLAGVAASMLPDLDVLSFRLGIDYSDAFGHRGFTHSIAFALALGLLALLCARSLKCRALPAFVFVSLGAASHGLLDMFTNGGHGVALWWPLSGERLFAPWRVIEASPLSLRRIVGGRGLEVLQSELLWVWLPAVIVFMAVLIARRRMERRAGRKVG